MAEFNIVPEIGGVDTSNPFRAYDCDEQFAVIDAIFGQGLALPGEQGDLAVRRRLSEKGFSAMPGKIYTPNDSNYRELLSGSWSDRNRAHYSGFLATATKGVLNAGRMVYLGQQSVVRSEQTAQFKHKANQAVKGIIAAAGIDSYKHPLGLGPIELHEVGQWLAEFAGHKRGEITTLAFEDRDITNPFILFGRRITERLHTFTNTKE